ncbi:putative electron transfer flavoprotein subunit [Entomortierella beljakovae]|nr:putative electron transfer flavoprotein subunit [Entomortierella beljakovae]
MSLTDAVSSLVPNSGHDSHEAPAPTNRDTRQSTPPSVLATSSSEDQSQDHKNVSKDKSIDFTQRKDLSTHSSEPTSPTSPRASKSTSNNHNDKGGSIPTSNALSSLLKSRQSTSVPLSSLTSTSVDIISPQPNASYGSSYASSRSMSAATSSLLMLSSSERVNTSQSNPNSKDQHKVVEDSESTNQKPASPKSLNENQESDVDMEAGHHDHTSHSQDGTDTDMLEVPSEAGSYSKPSTSTSKKRQASPHVSKSSSMTPSPRLNPEGSPRARKNSVSSIKKEHKPGVTATSCANCGTTTTPLWRRASNGQTICNACGLYFKARNLTRPHWLKRNMGLKKGESADELGSDSEDHVSNGEASSKKDVEGTSVFSIGKKAGDGESKDGVVHDSECAGTCPGDGNCNGAGGAESCAGCPSYNQHQTSRQNLVCANCRTTTTPLWRRDSAGNTICNACGLYFKLHNVHRPVTMKRAVIKRRKRVNLLANSPPPTTQQDSPQPDEQQQESQQSQQKQKQQSSKHQKSLSKSQQLKSTSHSHHSSTESDAELNSDDAQNENLGGTATKRRRTQEKNESRSVPPIEDYIQPKRSTNGHTEWHREQAAQPNLGRSMSPIESIGNGGHGHGHRHEYGHRHDRGYDGRDRPGDDDRDSHSYGSASPYSQHSTRFQDEHQSSSRYSQPSRHLNLHQSSGQYQPTHSMSMSRYPFYPPPLSSRSHLGSSHQHQLPPPSERTQQRSEDRHYQPQPDDHHPQGITMQGYQGHYHSHRSNDAEDGMHHQTHPSSYTSHSSSGWNTRLPGYATVSSSSSSYGSRLSSGATRPLGASNSPTSSHRYLDHRNSTSAESYSHYRSAESPRHRYHREDSPPTSHSLSHSHSYNGLSQTAPGNSISDGSNYSSSYHHSISSIMNSNSENSSENVSGRTGGRSTQLPPITLPSPHHNQTLPRASEILQHHPHQDLRSHHLHHPQQQQQQQQHYSSHSRRLPSPGSTIPPHDSHSAKSLTPPPTSAPSAPTAPSVAGLGADSLTNTDVLQKTRQDLQREVSHLSMLLGRAAAVLSGLDQALGPNGTAPATTATTTAAAQENNPPPTSDLTTNSALASLIALSNSGSDWGLTNGSHSPSTTVVVTPGSPPKSGTATYTNGSSSVIDDQHQSQQRTTPTPPPQALTSSGLHHHLQALPYSMSRRE